MTPAERITDAIVKRPDRSAPAIVSFLTGGFPEPARFAANLLTIATHSDVVEIGVPFTDPMADGLTIQRASHAAIASGVSLTWIFDELSTMQPRPDAPLVLMSYLNPLLAFGIEQLGRRSLECGVDGYIVPDLPHEESDELRDVLDDAGLALVQLVTPVTPAERLKVLCEASRGFVYAVTTTGITGGGKDLPETVCAYLDRVRSVSDLPVCAGFGIRNRDQVAGLSGHADGVVVGSALVEVLERGDSPAQFINSLRPGSNPETAD